MPKISFYLIEKTAQRQADIACRLCQKIQHKHRIWLYFSDEKYCETVDQQLWQFEPTSFIPHGIDQQQAQICLSQQLPNPTFEVCFNLSSEPINLTELPHSILHLIEIVSDNPQDKQLAREKFKSYREMGIEPIIHKI